MPSPAEQEEVWIGSRYVYAFCALSVAAAVWSHLRGNPVWVTVWSHLRGNPVWLRVWVALPGILVGLAAWVNPHNLMRHPAA
ncbi:hypothetical protein ACW0JT_14635 [Arthrobacter sp. SA17]